MKDNGEREYVEINYEKQRHLKGEKTQQKGKEYEMKWKQRS
jgi:hypothetical protein